MPDSILNQHSTTILKRVIARFEEDRMVLEGMGGFFTRVTSPTLDVSVEVIRDSDPISTDVERFTEGNHNKVTRTAEKLYRPPYHKELYDFSRDEVYMTTVALGVLTSVQANRAISQNALKNVRKNRNKIERAILKQQADVLQTGVVTLTNGDNISYRRKASSMVDLGAGNYWDASGSDPIANISTGLTFLRDEGASSVGTAVLIMRTAGLNALLNNANIKEGVNFRRSNRTEITMPQLDGSRGMAMHGTLAAGDYQVQIWTYNQSYTNAAGTRTYYLNQNNAILLPEDFEGRMMFGGLPSMAPANIGGVNTMVPTVVETDYLLRSYGEERTISSVIELSSAPLAVPYTIDRMYTMQILS